MNILITGSSGLIGSEAVIFYDHAGHNVIGIDNNMRAEFFGPAGDTTSRLFQLIDSTSRFTHYNIDICDCDSIFSLFKRNSFDLIVHCAAQPSHDKAKEIPLIDFKVNAMGTLNILEATRRYSPQAVLIHMSTNKVYGDIPNKLPLVELETRYHYQREEDYYGISENCRIDQCLHSLFGASKTSGDIMAQEYGRYFGLKVGIFRGGCLTGPHHAGVELHGFLSYLIEVAVNGSTYTIFGYKGKQVRDNIHSFDVIQAFEAFRKNPRLGEVYNIGGGRENSVSILEAITLLEKLTNRKVKWVYNEQNRIGDHICYYTDLRKLKSHFPEWQITRSLTDIFQEIIDAKMTH